jgi:hypothetical protein
MSPGAATTAASHGAGGDSHDSGGVKVAEIGVCDRLSWDALMLYGEERFEEVRNLAKASVDKAGKAGYLLAIALARLDGDERGFEDLAVQYAVETDQSPPVWVAPKEEKKEGNERSATVVHVRAMTADNILEATIKMETPWPIVIDLGSVSKIDTTGIELFNESLTGRIERGEETGLVNAERIIDNLGERLRIANVISQPKVWECLFNLMLLGSKKEAFEKLAMDYAEKTGKRMQWRELIKSEEKPEDVAPPTGIEAGERLSMMGGEFQKQVLAHPLTAASKLNHEPVAIDFLSTRYWSFADAAVVMDFLRTMHKEKVTVRFVNVNELLEALFRAAGIHRHVQIVAPGAIT